MHIDAPDPYPGRCRNYRTEISGSYRCSDYEAVPHQCSFPDLKPKGFGPGTPRAYGWGGSITTVTKPKPWVKPGDEKKPQFDLDYTDEFPNA